METTGAGAGSGSSLCLYLPHKVSGRILHDTETEGSALPSRTTARLEISPSLADPWRCDLSTERSPPPSKSVCTSWMWERGVSRSTKRPFFCVDTGKQYLYFTSHKCVGPRAPFWSGSIVPILLCAYSFFLRPRACWGGVRAVSK